MITDLMYFSMCLLWSQHLCVDLCYCNLVI